jgi:hypothetical protein
MRIWRLLIVIRKRWKQERVTMYEKPDEQDSEKVDLTYAEAELPPPEAGGDIYSYKNILLTQSKWAWPSSGLKLVVGWAIVAFGCVGCNMLVIVVTRGWDGLLTLLGWK